MVLCGPGRPPGPAVGHVEPGFAGPVGRRLGGDFLPVLLSSAFQRRHRTLPGRQEGAAWGGDLGWETGWVTQGGRLRVGDPGWVTQGG